MKRETALVQKLLRLMELSDFKSFCLLLLKHERKGSDLSFLWRHPLGDDLLDFYQKSKQEAKLLRSGFVYILINPVLRDVYKIGFTRRKVGERVKALNKAGVAADLIKMVEVPCYDACYVEAEMHRRLKHRHITKEFYQEHWSTLIAVLNEVSSLDNQRWEQAP